MSNQGFNEKKENINEWDCKYFYYLLVEPGQTADIQIAFDANALNQVQLGKHSCKDPYIYITFDNYSQSGGAHHIFKNNDSIPIKLYFRVMCRINDVWIPNVYELITPKPNIIKLNYADEVPPFDYDDVYITITLT